MADFSKTNLSKFAVISVKRRQKVGFSGPVKLQNHTNELREKERRKIMRKEKDRRKRKKAMSALLNLILATLEKKKMLHPKGPFSNILHYDSEHHIALIFVMCVCLPGNQPFVVCS